MKKFLFFLLNFCFLSAATYAQTGLIVGKIIDEQTGEVLPGASVRLSGTNTGVATNLAGEFSIRVQSGSTSITVAYLGYAEQQIDVQVSAGQTSTVEVKMQAATNELRDIIITGQLQGQNRALNQQKNADNIKNIVAADQIARFPDPNVAEALQRVPGVNVARDEGEGRYVLIRGLAPQFTNISINGEQIPSPEDDSRFVALDAIPADQLASMEVTKAITPEMDGDAVGGNVNLITRGATSEEFDLSGTAALEYNNLMKRAGGQFALQASQRVGKFGWLVNANYYISRRGSDKVEPSDYDFGQEGFPLYTLELRDYEINRDRLGLSTTLDYKFNDNNEVYFRGLFGQLYEVEKRRRIGFLADRIEDPDEENEIRKEIKDRPENQGVMSFNLGARHNLPKFRLDYEVAYSRANQDTPSDRQLRFIIEDPEISFDTTDPEYPRVSINEGANPNFNNTNFTSVDDFIYDEYENEATTQLDQNWTAKFNLELPFQLGTNKSGSIKFGAKTRLKEKKFVTDNFQSFSYEGDDDLLLADFTGGLEDDDFLNGDYKLGLFPDNERFGDFAQANPDLFEIEGEEDLELLRAEQDYEADEDVYAAYVQARFQLNKLTVLGGVRYEFTDVNYKASLLEAVETEEDETEGRLFYDGGNDYDYFLPMIHLKYALSPFTNLRAAATYSFARPNFSDIFGDDRSFSRNADNEGEADIANFQLEPVTSVNLDLLAEHYFGNVGVLSGGIFYKRLDNFIYRRFRQADFLGFNNIEITQSVNGETADLLGFEIAYQQNLDFLPGVLSGLGLYFNYTYTWSEARVTDRVGAENETETIRLPGQAEHVGNVALFYNKGGFSGRIMANFNGEFIDELGDNSAQDYFVDDRVQLDLAVNQRLNKNLNLFLELINLTNQKRVDFRGNLDRPLTRELYGFWGRLGVKFNL